MAQHAILHPISDDIGAYLATYSLGMGTLFALHLHVYIPGVGTLVYVLYTGTPLPKELIPLVNRCSQARHAYWLDPVHGLISETLPNALFFFSETLFFFPRINHGINLYLPLLRL